MSPQAHSHNLRRIQPSDGVRAKPIGALPFAKLDHRISLDLTDPLARQAEQFSDVIERSRLAVV